MTTIANNIITQNLIHYIYSILRFRVRGTSNSYWQGRKPELEWSQEIQDQRAKHGGVEFVYGTQFWFVKAENLYLGRKFPVCIVSNLLDLKFIGSEVEAKNFQKIANFEVQIRFHEALTDIPWGQIGRASCRERVCQYV